VSLALSSVDWVLSAKDAKEHEERQGRLRGAFWRCFGFSSRIFASFADKKMRGGKISTALPGSMHGVQHLTQRICQVFRDKLRHVGIRTDLFDMRLVGRAGQR
jgi:hypothetical protein